MSANIVLRQTADQITINRANPDILLVGVAGPAGAAGPGGVLGYYGAFSSYVAQAAASTTEDYPFRFEQTDESNGVSITQGTDGFPSRITFAAAGTYNIQFSAQFQNTDNSAHDVQIWLRKNETNVTGSTGFVSIPAKHAGEDGHSITGWNFVFTVAANDYYEFFWQTDNVGISIVTYPGGTTPTTPSTASLVLTVTQVMNTQLGPTGPAGTPGDWATLQTINTQTSSYTIVSSDVGKLVSLNSSGALSLTVNTGTVIGTGGRIDLLQFGAGQVTVGGTATINGTPTLKLRTQYSAATLICVASNSFVLVGDLAAS
jgi:hypothetical protein